MNVGEWMVPEISTTGIRRESRFCLMLKFKNFKNTARHHPRRWFIITKLHDSQIVVSPRVTVGLWRFSFAHIPRSFWSHAQRNIPISGYPLLLLVPSHCNGPHTSIVSYTSAKTLCFHWQTRAKQCQEWLVLSKQQQLIADTLHCSNWEKLRKMLIHVSSHKIFSLLCFKLMFD